MLRIAQISPIAVPLSSDPRVAAIDALLPQTQCTQCGYAGCEPYAMAIAAGEADINQCPPGGEEGVGKLAELLGLARKPLNPVHGPYKPRAVALVVEADCIGCTLCIQACPVDAIVGAAKSMHTVLAEECTGCELCIAPCPVDCIVMAPCAERDPQVVQASADRARQRFRFHRARLSAQKAAAAARLAEKMRAKSKPVANAVSEAKAAIPEKSAVPAASDKMARIQAMMDRAKALRGDVTAK